MKQKERTKKTNNDKEHQINHLTNFVKTIIN
jgi:hypothetical protein